MLLTQAEQGLIIQRTLVEKEKLRGRLLGPTQVGVAGLFYFATEKLLFGKENDLKSPHNSQVTI